MLVKIETYYDFRSPYAYFADCRIRRGDPSFSTKIEWVGRPMFIDVTLNLQLGKEPWAPFVDTLIPPKRAYLNADIGRMAEYYGAPCKPVSKPFYKPSRSWPNSPSQILALCVASLLSGQVEQAFRSAIFDGLFYKQLDISDPTILREVLVRAGGDPAIVDRASDQSVHDALTRQTMEAYSTGVFGTPTFVWNGELFFGADRLEVLAWRVNSATRSS